MNDIILENEQEVIECLTSLAFDRLYVFRGYSYQNELLPHIIRGADMSNVEFELLEEFGKYASCYFVADTPMDFLTCAQHYGLPTRLLDFTYNPFIALFFALFNDKYNSKDPIDDNYYYISYCKIADQLHLKGLPIFHEFTFGHFDDDSILNKLLSSLQSYDMFMCTPDEEWRKSYHLGVGLNDFELTKMYYAQPTEKTEELISNAINKKIKEKKICFIAPPYSNQRIMMQQGIFMMPYTLDKEEHLTIIKNNTKIIKIHKKCREKLLLHLDVMGINTFKLMPDLASACREVKRRLIKF